MFSAVIRIKNYQWSAKNTNKHKEPNQSFESQQEQARAKANLWDELFIGVEAEDGANMSADPKPGLLCN